MTNKGNKLFDKSSDLLNKDTRTRQNKIPIATSVLWKKTHFGRIVCLIKISRASTSLSLSFKAFLFPSSALLASLWCDLSYLLSRSAARCELKAHSAINISFSSAVCDVCVSGVVISACRAMGRGGGGLWRHAGTITPRCWASSVDIQEGKEPWSWALSSPVSTVNHKTWSLFISDPASK